VGLTGEVQDLDGIAIEDADHLAGEGAGRGLGGEEGKEKSGNQARDRGHFVLPATFLREIHEGYPVKAVQISPRSTSVRGELSSGRSYVLRTITFTIPSTSTSAWRKINGSISEFAG